MLISLKPLKPLFLTLRALVSKENPTTEQNDLATAHHLALNGNMGIYGKYLYQADESDTDTFNSNPGWTYNDLILLLASAPMQSTELFLLTLGDDIKATINNYFSGLVDTDGDVLISFEEYVNGTTVTAFGNSLMQLFKANEFISSSISDSDAKNLTFGDITDSDVKAMAADMISHSPHQFMWSLIKDSNTNNLFDSSEVFTAILQDSYLSGLNLTWAPSRFSSL